MPSIPESLRTLQWSLVAHIGLDPAPVSDNSSSCSDTGNPTLRNYTLEGTGYGSLNCPTACPLYCDVVGIPDHRGVVNTQYSRTFWVYLALRVPAQFFVAAAFSMMVSLRVGYYFYHLPLYFR